MKNFKYITTGEESVIKIDSYILDKEVKGKKVYILDATAPFYMIPLDKYNKDFDMFMKGNFGARRRRRIN